MSELTNPREIRRIMDMFGISPRREFGQNFLINDAIPKRIADAAVGEFAGDACALEIGPGIGAMTRELAARCRRVLAVEIDSALIPVLEYTLCGLDAVEVVNRDILDCDVDKLARDAFGGSEFHVCANLPYYITTPIIMRLLEHGGELLRSVTVMVQSEVADRLTASPATPEYGAISASVAYHGRAKKLFSVSTGNFLPAPKVNSAVVKIDLYRKDDRPVRAADDAMLGRVVAGAFGQRRKTLSNSLASAFPEIGRDRIASVISSLGLDPRVRGEALGIETFAALADAISAESSADAPRG